MINWIEAPYVAHIVADIDDNEDPAPEAWSSTLARRSSTDHAPSGFSWSRVTRRSWGWLRRLPGFATLLLAFAALACSDSSDPARPIAVAAVTVTPPQATLTVGATIALHATPRDASGHPLEGRSVAWLSSNHTVATVAPNGLVTAVSAGAVEISATSEGKTGRAELTLVPVPVPDRPVDHVEIDVAAAALEEGGTQQLVAMARDAAGNVVSGRAVQWTTSDPAVASVDAVGRVTAVRAGTAVIRARVDAKTAEATVRVTSTIAYDLIFDASVPLSRPEIYRQDVRDPQSTARRIFAAGRWAVDPVPSPDGRRIVVAVANDAGDTDLYVVPLDGSGFTRVTSGDGYDDQPVWSPDGRRVAFRRFTQQAGAEVWVADLETGTAANLTADQAGGQFSPAWAPNGDRLAYSHAAGGVAHVWSMRADGGDKRAITGGDVFDDQASWSPDGMTIVFQRTATGIFGDLYLVNATGGNERKLMPFVDLAFGQFAPAWSPDGRLIAFSSKHEGGVYQIYTVWPDGSKLARRTNGEMNKQSPAWIPREAAAGTRR